MHLKITDVQLSKISCPGEGDAKSYYLHRLETKAKSVMRQNCTLDEIYA